MLDIKVTYTMEQWGKDGTFKAETGQTVEREIYEQMRDCVPPLRLADSRYNRAHGVVNGFRVGEPYMHAESPTTGKETMFCAAFGKCDDGEYCFLGCQNAHGEIYDKDTGKVVDGN